MKATGIASGTNTQILDEASAWFVEVSEGGLDACAREAFNRWLRSSPEHVRAYLETAAIWESAALIDRHKRHETQALVAMALKAANIVPIAKDLTPALSSKRRGGERESRRAIAASIAVLFAGVGALAWHSLGRFPSYATDIGEQHSVALVDGSTVMLNSSSRIRVRFTESGRDIELLQGQALFDVAKDPLRPFVVHSGATQVTAVGTQFDVDRRRRGTIVTVLEGRVSVSAVKNAPSYVSAGEQLAVTAQSVSPPGRADVAAATAWTQRRLVFSSTSLEEVAEQYNRYHERRLVIRDRELDSFNISGTFSSTDAASLIDFLREQPGIAVHETSSGIVIVTK